MVTDVWFVVVTCHGNRYHFGDKKCMLRWLLESYFLYLNRAGRWNENPLWNFIHVLCWILQLWFIIILHDSQCILYNHYKTTKIVAMCKVLCILQKLTGSYLQDPATKKDKLYQSMTSTTTLSSSASRALLLELTSPLLPLVSPLWRHHILSWRHHTLSWLMYQTNEAP